MPPQEEAIVASKESLQSLQTLRSEQQRLKSEYERMEVSHWGVHSITLHILVTNNIC